MKINKKAFFGIMASLVSILVGLIIGLILLFIFDSSRAIVGFEALIGTGISSADKLAKVLYQAAPLILTGLSVAFAFKTGLFNIGAPGQYTVGMFCALFAATVLRNTMVYIITICNGWRSTLGDSSRIIQGTL